MLNAFSLASTAASAIKVPRLYLFDRQSNTQILEDFPETTDLKSILVSSRSDSVPMASQWRCQLVVTSVAGFAPFTRGFQQKDGSIYGLRSQVTSPCGSSNFL